MEEGNIDAAQHPVFVRQRNATSTSLCTINSCGFRKINHAHQCEKKKCNFVSESNVEDIDLSISKISFDTAMKNPSRACYRIEYIVITGVIIFAIILATVPVFKKVADHEGHRLLVPPDPEDIFPYTNSRLDTLKSFKRGAISSDAPPCSRIGKSMLERNGSAVDAAIATMICTGIVSMQAMGIGGGFLMTIYDRATKKAYTLNARGRAPLAANVTMFVGRAASESAQGPLTVAVPGEVAGYWEAHQRFGQLPWRTLFQPTIELCEMGYNMSLDQYDSLTYSGESVFEDSTLKELFVDPETNELKKPGTVIKPLKLCNVLRQIALKNATEFYNGTIARDIVSDLRRIGGIITDEDMRTYRAVWEDPVEETFSNGIKLYVPGIPASGHLLAMILNILDSFQFTPESLLTINSTILTYHKISEALKFAYACRTNFGDKNFVDMTEMTRKLTSKDYARSIMQKIDDNRTYSDPRYYGSAVSDQSEDHGTAHVSVLASNGDAVSVTSTINFYFGSGVVSEKTGIVLNNLMDDFGIPGKSNYYQFPPSPNNFIGPAKQPVSSKVPSILVDPSGNVHLVIGAVGGSKITSAVAQVIAKILWMGHSLAEAVDAPRIHHQLLPKEMQYEYGVPKPVIEGLQQLGHETQRYRQRNSIVCAIYQMNGTVYANADRRKTGDVCGID